MYWVDVNHSWKGKEFKYFLQNSFCDHSQSGISSAVQAQKSWNPFSILFSKEWTERRHIINGCYGYDQSILSLRMLLYYMPSWELVIFNCIQVQIPSFFTQSAGHQLPRKAGLKNGEGERRRELLLRSVPPDYKDTTDLNYLALQTRPMAWSYLPRPVWKQPLTGLGQDYIELQSFHSNSSVKSVLVKGTYFPLT